MGPSLYTGDIKLEDFRNLIIAITRKYTDPEARMPFLHQLFLDKEFSPNGTFASISELVTNFMVDVVATDSKLPLKNREKISFLQGYLPKLGNEMKLNEQQMQDLDAMVAMGNMPIDDLIARLFRDADTLIRGGLLRNEYLFLQGLSTGKAVVTDKDNVGIQFECDYQFLPQNKNYATTVWGTASATPWTDLSNSVDQALNDGVILSQAFMDYKTFQNLLKSDEVKALFATINVAPSRNGLRDLLDSELGLRTIHIINRTVTAQINNKNETKQAWAEGQITLTTDDQLGKLVWTRTAEFRHNVAGVMYSDADEGVFLLSKYGDNNPVAEFTSIQGRCLPVLSNVQLIYQLDTTKISA